MKVTRAVWGFDISTYITGPQLKYRSYFVYSRVFIIHINLKIECVCVYGLVAMGLISHINPKRSSYVALKSGLNKNIALA